MSALRDDFRETNKIYLILNNVLLSNNYIFVPNSFFSYRQNHPAQNQWQCWLQQRLGWLCHWIWWNWWKLLDGVRRDTPTNSNTWCKSVCQHWNLWRGVVHSETADVCCWQRDEHFSGEFQSSNRVKEEIFPSFYNGMMFKRQDNDMWGDGNCASNFCRKGAGGIAIVHESTPMGTMKVMSLVQLELGSMYFTLTVQLLAIPRQWDQ